MSPSMNHLVPFHRVTSFRAVWVLLLGLKPCEYSENMGSYISSSTLVIALCTTLSLGPGTPRGRIPPLAFGMKTLLIGLNLNVWSFNA